VIFVIVEREKYLIERDSMLQDLHLGAKINPLAGCTGRGEKEREEERYLQDKSTDRIVCFSIISRNTVLWMYP
jgi:hypothetical protein